MPPPGSGEKGAPEGACPSGPEWPGRAAWSNYYEPLRNRLRALEKVADRTPALDDVIAGLDREIDVYDCAGDEVALCFFVARRAPGGG